MIELKKARLCDIESMQNLVKDEVESGVLLPRSDEEIATSSFTKFCILSISQSLAFFNSIINQKPLL